MSTEDWNNLNGNHEDLKPLSDPRPVMAPVLNPTTISQSNIQPVTQPVVEETASVSETKKRKKEKDTSSSSDLKKIMAVAVCAAMFGGIAGMGGMMLYSRNWGNQVRYEAVSAARKAAQNNDGSTKKSNVFSFPDSTTILQGERDYTAINTASVNTNEKHTAAEVYAANVNSTVGINTSIDYNYYGYETTAAASGSGFILTSDGYIVTNHHVVDGAKEVQVTAYDGTTYDAVIVGFDESNDLTVLKIEASDLTPVVIGNSDQMNVGD
jgi:serine protease Do